MRIKHSLKHTSVDFVDLASLHGVDCPWVVAFPQVPVVGHSNAQAPVGPAKAPMSPQQNMYNYFFLRHRTPSNMSSIATGTPEEWKTHSEEAVGRVLQACRPMELVVRHTCL